MAKKKPVVIQLPVGVDVPEGLVVLDSCGTCKHALFADTVGIFCNRDGGYSDDQSTMAWQWWSERTRTLGNLWCPGFERPDAAVVKLVRKEP